MKKNNEYEVDFNKLYQSKLQDFYLEQIEEIVNDFDENEKKTGWIIIPSIENDFQHFEENTEKLKTLSHKKWSTKSFYAKPSLWEGDFHIYIEDAKPKLGLVVNDNQIKEIENVNYNSIPLQDYDKVEKHIEKNNLYARNEIEAVILSIGQSKRKFTKAKEDIKEAIENNDAKTILEYFGFDVKKNFDKTLTISRYNQPDKYFSFADLGIDEDKLFEHIKIIKNDADFRNSQITNLGKLKTIGGSAYFYDTKITNLGKLKTIYGNADFRNSQITNIDNIKCTGDIYFDYVKED